MKKILAALLVASTLVLGACSEETGADTTSQTTVESIKEAGVLRVGVKDDVPNFGLRNTGTNEIEGFEIDLAKKIAEEILGDPDAIEFTPVTAKTRGPLLDNGEVDILVSTFTITEERKETYNFTTPYYEDAVGILVKKDKGYEGLADMDGATIGVSQSSTTSELVAGEAEQYGIELSFSEYATYPEIKAALDSGRVDAFSVDRSILNGYIDDSTVILPDRFGTQEYGAVAKKTNTELAEYLNGLVEGWLEDGTIEDMIGEWGLAD